MTDPDNVEVCQQSLQAVEAGDIERLGTFLAPGFIFDHNGEAEAVDRETFVEAMVALTQAFPDLDYQAHGFREISDGLVEGKVQLTGTHTGALDLGFMGGPTVPPTGQRFELPEEEGRFVVDGGRILRHRVLATPGGGLAGILTQLGVEMPAPADQRPPEITTEPPVATETREVHV